MAERQSDYWRWGEKKRAAFRSALVKRLKAGDSSARAEEEKLTREALGKVDLRNDALKAKQDYQKAEIAAAEKRQQRMRALRPNSVRVGAQMYVAQEEKAAANSEYVGYQRKVASRTEDDLKKEIEAGRDMEARKRAQTARWTGETHGKAVQSYLAKLKSERDKGVVKSPAQLESDLKQLRKLIVAEKMMKEDYPSEAVARMGVSDMDAAKAADAEASRIMEDLDLQSVQKAKQVEDIRAAELDRQDRRPFSRASEDMRERDLKRERYLATRKQATAGAPVKRKSKKKPYSLSKEQDKKPSNWSDRVNGDPYRETN